MAAIGPSVHPSSAGCGVLPSSVTGVPGPGVCYPLVFERVRLPVSNGISKWFDRHTSQDVCPWNVSFSRDATEPAFAPRPAIAGKDARTLAREILAMDNQEFRTAFKNSPMKRAKLTGLKRNAVVVLENIAVQRSDR